MVDVFISYSRDDRAAVSRLAEAVEAAGYDVWWDDDLPPHMSYGDVITSKIGQAKAAIVVWSSNSVQSEWVRAEADVARNQKKLIQTALDSVMPPLPFNQIQFAEIGGWQGEPDHPGWRKVKASLAELCGPPRQAQPTQPAQPAASQPPAPTLPATPPPAAKQPSRAMYYGGLALLGAVVVLALGVWLGKGTPSGGGDAAGTEVAALDAPAAPPVAAVPAAATSSAPAAAADQQNRHVTIQNQSSQTLRELYASPVTSDSWEEDLLGSRVLAAGESIDANIYNGTAECLYDLKAVMADDREHVQRRVNVCEVSRWTIGDGGDSTS